MQRLLRRLVVGAGLVFFIIPLLVLSGQGTEPVVGTWKLNLVKSSFSPGPPPQSDIRSFEDRGDGLILVNMTVINAQGKSTNTQIAAKYDGKDYPIATTGATAVGTIAYMRVDRYTVKYSDKAGGKVTTSTVRTVSKDGKTMTQTTTGTDAQGRPVNNVLVFDKQ